MKLIVKKNIKKTAENFNVKFKDNSDGGYRDLMANVEGQVQRVLEEAGIPSS